MAVEEKSYQSPLPGFASAINTFGNMIFGAPKTTTTTRADQGSIDALNRVGDTAEANANDTSITDAIVNNIMRNAAVAFAPSLGAEKTAGLYNSSTLQQLASESKARATGEASQAVLSYRAGQLQTAAQARAAVANASKTTVARTAPSIPPMVSTALSAAMLGKSIISNRKAISSFLQDPIKGTKDLLGFGDDAEDIADVGASGGGAGGIDLSGGSFFNGPSSGGMNAAFAAPTANVGTFDTPSFFAADGTPSFLASPATDATATASAPVATGSGEGLTTLSSDAGPSTSDLIASGTAVDSAGNPITDEVGNALTQSSVDDAASLTDASAIADTASSVDDAASLSSAAADDFITGSSSVDDAADLVGAGADSGAFDFADSASSIDDAADLTGDVGTSIFGDTVGSALDAYSPIGWVHAGLNLIDPGENLPFHEEFNDLLSPIYNTIGGAVSGAINGISDTVDNIGDAFTDIGNGDVIGAIGNTAEAGFDSITDVASGIGDAVTSGSIVCTEAMRQGLLDQNLANEELKRNFLRLQAGGAVLRGYHWLALPIVKKMRVSKTWARGASAFANAYCNEIVHGTGGFLGWMLRYIGEPLCWLLGNTVAREPQPIEQLYAAQKE